MSVFKFGIMGAGNISNRFCDAVRRINGDIHVAAVSSKSEERARSFAEKNDIPRYYVGYENMLSSEELDAVYIATTNNFHTCFQVKSLMLCISLLRTISTTLTVFLQ